MYLSRNHGENRDTEFEAYSTRISRGQKKQAKDSYPEDQVFCVIIKILHL
jgi:hypothetical protein